MKLTYLAAIVMATIALSACAPKVYYSITTNVIDYQKYTDQGFFLSESNSINFDYTPVGSISTLAISGISDETERPSRYNQRDLNGQPMMEKVREFREATIDNAIESAIAEAKAKGANGIINLKITQTTHNDPKSGKPLPIITLSGMAIRK